MSKVKKANSIKYWRDICRNYSRTYVKVAEIGGNQDIPFEQAFSNLAHAYLKDKAPALLDFEIGFQLIDRNQENTKAIGVFGFKVGNQWLYAPVFFLNGDLKGHELLYLKTQDIFVPLKENWINYVLNRKPHVLGQGVTRNMQQLGVMPPNLYQLSRSPLKFAAAKNWPEWAQDALVVCAHAAMMSPSVSNKYKELNDLPAVMKKEGRAIVIPLLKTCQTFPKLASAVDQFYGLNVIKEAIEAINAEDKKLNERSVLSPATQATIHNDKDDDDNTSSVLHLEEKDPIKTGALKIAIKADLEKPSGDEFESMDDKDREVLLRDGVMIKDKRMNVSKAYTVQQELKLMNPNSTGIYEVLTKPGDYEKCLVILGPHASSCRKNFATVVRLDKDKNWMNIHPSYVFTGSKLGDEGYRKWFDGLPDANTLKPAKNKWYVIIGPGGQGTLPFCASKELSDENGVKTFDVNFVTYATKERPDHLKHVNFYSGPFDGYDPGMDGEHIVFTGKDGASMRTTRGSLYITNGFKLISIDPPEKDDDDDDGDNYNKPKSNYAYSTASGRSDVAPINLGNLDDVQLLLMKKTAGMKIQHTGTHVIVNDIRMRPIQGLIHLVKDHGLSEKQARAMISEAESNQVAKFRIKYADEYYDLQRSGPTSPTLPDIPQGFDPMTSGMYPTQSMLEARVPIPGMSAQMTNRDIYRPQGPDPDYQAKPDLQAVQYAQQAAQTGQKEIFDTTMLGSLLKATRDDSMVDRYLPDMMKGMDRIGRILFIFYWHQEQFADRYGKSELPELEDGMRNAFEAVGDIFLKLKERTIDPYPDELAKVDLGPVSEM